MIRKIGLLLIILFSFKLYAHEPESLPDPLNYDRRQATNYRFELSPFIGDFFGDKLTHSFVAGGNLQWNITEFLGISGNFGYSRAAADRTSDLGKSLTNKNLLLMDGGFVITYPAAYSNQKGKITELDFYSSIGAGAVEINGSSHFGGYIGGGIKLRPKVKWLAIRVDLRDYFTSLNNPSGSDFENVLTLVIGPTFLLPPEM